MTLSFTHWEDWPVSFVLYLWKLDRTSLSLLNLIWYMDNIDRIANSLQMPKESFAQVSYIDMFFLKIKFD